MILKSYITKGLLAIMPITLLSGYSLRIATYDKFADSPSAVYASESPIVYELEVKDEIKKVEEKIKPFYQKPLTTEQKIKNIKVKKSEMKGVQNYLLRIHAPLASKSKFLVQAAKYYKIDYRLVAAISVVESTGGKFAYKPHNAWGWGGSRGYTFKSWEEGIMTVSKGLARYYSNGAVHPSQIAPSYNPVTPKEWAGKVESIMYQMR